MQTKRLNEILERQKRVLKLDVLLAVMFVIAIGLAAIAFVTTAPSMTPCTQDNHTDAAQLTDQTPAQITSSILDEHPRHIVVQ